MNLTKREQKLLIILGVLLVFWAYFKFIVTYQLDDLKAKQEDKLHYETELRKVKTLVDSEKDLDQQFGKVTGEIEIMSKKYFPNLDQSRLIVLINELLEGTDLFVENISFSPLRTQDVEDAQVEVMSVTLPYEGKYSSLLLFLERIRNNNPKIIIQNLDIKVKDDEILYGSILLDFHSVGEFMATEDRSIAYLFDSSEVNHDPFAFFENQDENGFMVGEEYEEIDLSNVKIDFERPRVLVEGFENNILDFVPSHPSLKGEVGINKNSRQGNYSLGLHYSFPPIQEKKQIHLVFDRKPVIEQYPESIGLWVYSYDATRHGIKLTIKDKKGVREEIILHEKIDWIGWKHLSVSMPQNKFTFPVEVERILVDIDSSNYGKGTLLIDGLEAFYSIDTPDDLRISNTNSQYQFYEVKEGDTLSSISKAFYNDASKKDLLKKCNGIANDSDLNPGKIMIIPSASLEEEE